MQLHNKASPNVYVMICMPKMDLLSAKVTFYTHTFIIFAVSGFKITISSQYLSIFSHILQFDHADSSCAFGYLKPCLKIPEKISKDKNIQQEHRETMQFCQGPTPLILLMSAMKKTCKKFLNQDGGLDHHQNLTRYRFYLGKDEHCKIHEWGCKQ